MADAPEKIWASSVTDTYGEWQTTMDGLPRPTEYTRSDKVAELAAENERLRKVLEAATGLLRRVPGALNSEFSAGMEEREGGSANRQEKLLQASEALRRDIDAFIARRALEGGE